MFSDRPHLRDTQFGKLGLAVYRLYRSQLLLSIVIVVVTAMLHRYYLTNWKQQFLSTPRCVASRMDLVDLLILFSLLFVSSVLCW